MKIVALVCLMISFFMHTTSLSAQNSQKYKPYQHIFNHRTHIDGEPLLADGKVEFYLFPGAKRERSGGGPRRVAGASVVLVGGQPSWELLEKIGICAPEQKVVGPENFAEAGAIGLQLVAGQGWNLGVSAGAASEIGHHEFAIQNADMACRSGGAAQSAENGSGGRRQEGFETRFPAQSQQARTDRIFARPGMDHHAERFHRGEQAFERRAVAHLREASEHEIAAQRQKIAAARREWAQVEAAVRYGFGARMPRGGAPYWTSADIGKVRQWISEGAKGADGE